MADVQATTEQPVAPGDVSPRGFDAQVMLLTWVAFAVAAIVLAKLLWRPLLAALEAREGEIRDSLAHAEQARKAAADADAAAAQTLAAAEQKARAQADAQAAAARAHVAEMETAAREALAVRRQAAEEALADEREATLKKLGEQAGGEIAHALETLLPGMLTEAQRQAYQDRIAAAVNFR